MASVSDPVALDAWYVVGLVDELAPGRPETTRLLGRDLTLLRDGAGAVSISLDDGAAASELPVVLRWGFVWTTLGQPTRGVFDLAEADEPGRRVVTCGKVRVAASGLRLVENFLDMAHFPFVHQHILGALEHPEVEDYKVEIREDVDEVWATDCRFWQPLAALTSQEGQVSHYLYRVATPFNVLLYKTCPAAPDRFDAIALLIQPVEEDVSIAYPLMVVIDPDNADADIVMFQQRIFMQDRLILENQRPSRLPLAAGAEIPVRGDLSSVVYRRWLRQKGLKYGVHEHASA